MTYFTTEPRVRREIQLALERKCAETKRQYDPRELETPEYQQWIKDRVDELRREGRIVTERQFRLVEQQRTFKPGERCRYIGQTAIETSKVTGAHVTRPTGQIGHMSRVQKRAQGDLFVFQPDVTEEQRRLAATGANVEILALVTDNWTLFEPLE